MSARGDFHTKLSAGWQEGGLRLGWSGRRGAGSFLSLLEEGEWKSAITTSAQRPSLVRPGCFCKTENFPAGEPEAAFGHRSGREDVTTKGKNLPNVS